MTNLFVSATIANLPPAPSSANSYIGDVSGVVLDHSTVGNTCRSVNVFSSSDPSMTSQLGLDTCIVLHVSQSR